MKASKSITTLASQKQLNTNGQLQQQQQQQASNSAPTSPICRCRVTYLGSSVPHITKDGLQGIQEPLKELYPDKASLDQGNAGIDSWLSVWSNGILIENVDETGREVKRFFKIEALHYCAAVKYTNHIVDHHSQQQNTLASLPKFLPLDSPHARLQQANNSHPPIFASILRRTTGVKVLECHAFICKREAAANALVRCCFHAYADTMYAKQIGADIDHLVPTNERRDTYADNSNQLVQASNNYQHLNGSIKSNGAPPAIMARRSKSIAALNDHAAPDANEMQSGEYSDSSNRGNLNQQQQQQYLSSSVHRRKSLNGGNCPLNGDNSDTSQSIYSNGNNLQKHSFSKSMHQLNQPDSIYNTAAGIRPGQDFGDGSLHSNQSISYHNLANRHQANSSVPEPFYNPYASRVPSYPPQNIIDQQQTNNSGTLRSVKSVAANSIASTLLRSKKHAKAMSMAQLNNSNNQNGTNSVAYNHDRITSFHQPQYLHQHQQAATMGAPGSFLTLPPVPPMFMPNMPRLPLINGSQTMKLPSRHQQQQQQLIPGLGPIPPINFEAMTPKEMKKLLKKSAKYGIDPSKFSKNGLPLLPLRPMPMPMPPMPMQMPIPMQLPPPQSAIQTSCHMTPAHKSGTLGSQSLYSIDMHQSQGQHDMTDFSSQTLSYAAAMGLPPPPPDGSQGGQMQPIKSILVKPNPEFLKSKAGKKWLKQQKEFKKLLPPHLDGLPIVFGPPPLEALEPANPSTSNASNMQPPPPTFIHSPQLPPPPPQMQPPPTGLPMMDSNGYYNPHPFYGPSGRASAASTLLRYSPQSQIMHHHHQQQQHALYEASGGSINGNPDQQIELMHRNHVQSMYSDPMMLTSQQQQHQHQKMLQSQMLNRLNGNDSSSILYDQSSSQLNTFDRQFPFGSERLSTTSHRSRRNHMVEQSVISLGDEIDGEEEEDEENDRHRDMANNSDRYTNDNGHDDHEDGRSDGYYDRVGAGSMQLASQQQQQQQKHRHNIQRRRHHKSSSELNETNRRHDEHMGEYHEPDTGHQQQQQQQQSDDHSGSYSSAGIYRRKHINERAFSYSIRQEHKSNGTGTGSNSEADYVTDNGPDYSDSSHNYHRMAAAHNPPPNNINNNNNISNKSHNKINYQQQLQHQQRQAQSMAYDSPQVIQQGGDAYQTRWAPPTQPHQYTRSELAQQQAAADAELSERLNSQLNMKSFTNSVGGLKSNM